MTLSGLGEATTYHFEVSSADEFGNVAVSGDATFVTLDGSNPSGLVSDDFNVCAVDSGVWSFVDPVGDGAAVVNGTQLELSVPGGVSHDVWGANMAPRLVQPVTDADFEVEAKFESTVSDAYEMQGVLVEQDADDYLRFDVYGNGGQVYLFAARTVGGSPTALLNTAIPASGDPVFLRVGRVGDVWTLSYSVDGSSWVTAVSFEHSLVASSVGVFAGTQAVRRRRTPRWSTTCSTPANRSSPKTPTAPRSTWESVGGGSVDVSPERDSYGCGETVTLTATPDPGESFTGWSGDLSGTQNPIDIVMDTSKQVTANFGVDSVGAAGGVWCVGVVVCGFGGGVVVDGQAGDEFGGVW